MGLQQTLEELTRSFLRLDRTVREIKRLVGSTPLYAGKSLVQTLSGGSVAATRAFLLVKSQTGLIDTLDTITNVGDGRLIVVAPAVEGQTIHVRDYRVDGGNIDLHGNTWTLTSPNTSVLLQYHESTGKWHVVNIPTIDDLRKVNIVDGVPGQVLTLFADGFWANADVPGGGGGAVNSVNGYTGDVVLDPDDLDDTSTTHKFVSAAEKADIATAVQPGDLATVAFSGDYGDLVGTPTVPTTFDDLADGVVNKAFTDTEKTKLAGIAPGAEVNVNADWTAVAGDAEILNKPTLGTAAAADVGDFATAAQGATADSAVQPGDLDDVAFSGAYSDLSGTPSIPATFDDLADGTVNKAYTTTEKTKLSGIAAGAEVNVNADWTAVSGDALILNKPSIPTQYTDEMAQDAVGAMIVDTATIDLAYVDATPAITASVKVNSIDNSLLATMAQATVKGRAAGAGTGNPVDLSTAQLIAIIEAGALYALLAGRAGGQILNGDTAANGNLILRGTANATKTTSYLLLQDTGGFIGMGSMTTPLYLLHGEFNANNANARLAMQNPNAGNAVQVLLQLSNGTVALQGGVTGTGFTPVGLIGASHSYLQSNSGPLLVQALGNNKFEIATNGVVRQIITGAGLVGFGIVPIVDIHIHRTANSANVGLLSTNDGTGSATASMRAGLDPTNFSSDYVTLTILGAGWSPTGILKAGSAMVEGNSTNMIISQLHASEPLQFAMGASRTERMRLTTAGILMLGVTTAGASVLAVQTGGAANDAAVGGTLYVNTTTVGNVGAGEDNLHAYSIPGDTLDVNGKSIWFEIVGKCANNANVKQVSIYFGATQIFTFTPAPSFENRWSVRGRIIRTGAATQKTFTELHGRIVGSTIYQAMDVLPATETLSGIVVIKATGTGVSNNDITTEFMVIGWDDANS